MVLYNAKVKAYGVIIKYISTSLTPIQEVGVVALGPITNLILFIILAIIGNISYKLLGSFPEVSRINKFIILFILLIGKINQ